MPAPRISVAIPAHNEGKQIAETIVSLEMSAAEKSFEVVVADDGSCPAIELDDRFGCSVKVVRNQKRMGVASARNLAVRSCSSDLILITDAHVALSDGWDDVLCRQLNDASVISVPIKDSVSSFCGFGCSLTMPGLGTKWNTSKPETWPQVGIASSAGTAISRDLFFKLGGYDEGMVLYGSAEPEFSIRAWLFGSEVRGVEGIFVTHEFKAGETLKGKLRERLPKMHRNVLRMGMLYLDETRISELLYFKSFRGRSFSDDVNELLSEDIIERRNWIESRCSRELEWYLERFAVREF